MKWAPKLGKSKRNCALRTIGSQLYCAGPFQKCFHFIFCQLTGIVLVVLRRCCFDYKPSEAVRMIRHFKGLFKCHGNYKKIFFALFHLLEGNCSKH